jgi:preprotein translocase subunit SecF
MRLFANANYDFIGSSRRAFIALAVLMLPGLVMLLAKGVNYSIEFTGGTRMQIETQTPVDESVLRAALVSEGLAGAEIARFGSDREWMIRAVAATPGADPNDTQITGAAVRAALDQAVGAGTYTVVSTEAVGPKVGGELRVQAALLVLFSFVAVLIYLAVRFEWRFGVAAVTATIHDIVSAVAIIALLRLEVSLFVVGALLSIVGYSLNDKIVVLDRVRENLRKHQREGFAALLNRSINETLPRTVFTGTTALGSLVALAALGGDVVRGFAIVMLYGVIIGTFSSIFIAAPVLLYIEKRWPGAHVRGLKPTTPAPDASSSRKKAQPVP